MTHARIRRNLMIGLSLMIGMAAREAVLREAGAAFVAWAENPA